ncbi:CocE/NonD family hydrolase [Shimia sp. CNT1-13L.2]|uniref:CocE/NonD family hydrolase n=1 Tax=Shimia sp. CNT1-13L.2 TaxID=2959663 RepID=UPI0020CC4A10|nr:CocE/NonD family hydrolase [Shimia sp. CNT1-13L.2]MCP9483301.1 CocE/NonD family hydrolase [Shimia sp. CNT1-13L.2]
MNDINIKTEFPRIVREIENTWIPMPDGTKLAARIWLPEDAEDDPVPAILEYLPYRKRDGTVERDALTHPYFAGHGYAGVRVDMRGTGDSEGVCLGEYLLQEQDDALAIIEWLASQPWCSGKVGMIGISWGGFNGLQVAARRPAALGAVISLCSTDDRYTDDIHFMGGALLCDKLNWGATAFAIANTPPDPEIVGADRWRDMWKERLENNGLWMLDWFRHQRRDDLYSHGSVCENYGDIEVPVYMVGGWADGYTNAVFRTLEHLPGVKKGLVGPWAHKYPHFAKPGPRIGFLQECLRWWDQHLKGADTGIMDEPELRAWIQEPANPAPHFEERPGRWVAEPGWEGAGLRTHSLYPGGRLLSDTPTGTTLTLNSPQTAGATSGTWCLYGVDPDGPLDQNGEAGLMTSFETAPFEEDIDLLGFPMFHADFSSDAPQANIAVTLSAVNENGSATLISFGVLNLTHRNSHAHPEPMPRGQSVPATVQLNVCGQRIAKGQRLRLSLATAYWPVIWPSQTDGTLTLNNARIDLPIRDAREIDASLTPFLPPESAAPMQTEVISKGEYQRLRTIDCITGVETFERIANTGAETHVHTGITVHYTNRETYQIHPRDPNSAAGIQKWTKSYARGDWQAEVQTQVAVQALADVWRVEASLKAFDKDGIVAERKWREDVPRDLV